MRSCLILGSGRSGTSMVAGLFQQSGAFFGFEMMGATPANPRGYFEDRILNTLNDLIIQRLVGHRWTKNLPRGLAPQAHRDSRAFWLAAPRTARSLALPRELSQLVQIYSEKRPFCYKDPRFSVTLPTWRKHLPSETGFVVVFRDPHRTVDSVLRDVTESYEPPLRIPGRWAYTSWYRNYRRTLDEFSTTGDWFFADYEQIVDGSAVPALQAFARAKLTTRHVDSAMSRSTPDPHSKGGLAQRCETLYAELRRRAVESRESWTMRITDTKTS